MKFLIYIIIGVIGLLLLLGLIYFILLYKLKNLNTKISRRRKEEHLKENNVLIVYQPSIHKTTIKIASLIKEEILNKGYGYTYLTLNDSNEEYSKYKYVFFVAPVYFGQIHNEFINKVSKNKIKNLLIVYNGLNFESNKEDEDLKKVSISNYKMIKLHTNDIDTLKDFINKEVK